MAASITQTTVLPTGGAKLYTNSGTSDVIATLNMVSQTATSNPKVNVAYSSSSNLSLNGDKAASWSLPESVAAAACPISLNQSLTTQGKNAYAANIVDNSWGRMRAADLASSPDPNPGTQKTSQFLDPYFLISPTTWNSAFTTPPFAKMNSASLYFWWDFREALNGAGSFAKLFGNDADYTTGSATNQNASYYDYGGVYDPYTAVNISVASNAYMTIRQFYWTTFGATASSQTGDRSSDSCIYNTVGSGWSSYVVPQSAHPWATSFHADNGMFAIDTSAYSNDNNFILLNLGANFTAGTQTSSPDTYISTSKGVRPNLSEQHALRWLKYNPTTEKWYIYIGGDSASTGLYSFDQSGEYTTSTTGNNTLIQNATMFTKETSFNFPDEKMTCPARISSTTWLSYTSAGVAYHSTDLISWTLVSAETFFPTDYTMKNVGTDGISYYAKKGSDVIKVVDSGFSAVDKAGWMEHQTEVGRYERTGIIIPKGQSIYLENLDATASVSASLLTMDI